MEKTQLFLVHGGYTFYTHEDYINFLKTREIKLEKTSSWSDEYLRKQVEDKVQIIVPKNILK